MTLLASFTGDQLSFTSQGYVPRCAPSAGESGWTTGGGVWSSPPEAAVNPAVPPTKSWLICAVVLSLGWGEVKKSLPVVPAWMVSIAGGVAVSTAEEGSTATSLGVGLGVACLAVLNVK